MKWKILPTKLALTLVFMLISLHGISQLITGDDKSPNYKGSNGGEKNESFEVTFALVGGNGSIDAYITNYGHINSGTSIEQGTDIRFEAYPDWNYMVKEWRVNDVIVEGNTNNVFTYSNIQTSIAVTVEFKKYVEPDITPEWQYFGLDDAEDVIFTINWGSETEVTKITHQYEDEFGDHQQQNLTEGSDYSITGDVLTIYNSFIVSLSPEVSSEIQLEIEFNTGKLVWFGIEIINTKRAQVSPTELTYDLSNPGDLMTTILWGTTSNAVELISSVTINNLVEGTDYHIDGAWLYFHNSYLTQKLTTAGDELNLNVLFDNGDEVLLDVSTIKSDVTNATINPTSISFYEHEFPEYVDITITWNDATSVTNMHVLVSIEQESEEMDWPFYEVTDNGDGTAKLRINFDEVNKSNSSAAKKEELSYVTLTINFDVGAPALFLMTIIDEYYDVIVTIDPINAGWVNGQSDYSPGETVELKAEPNGGYVFWSWNDAITGDAISFENPYAFNMPSHDIELTAHFVPIQSFTVNFSVKGANGTLACMTDGNTIATGTDVIIASELVFAATPETGYRVKEWVLNNDVVEGNTSESFTIEVLSASVELTVEFELIPSVYVVTFIVTEDNTPIVEATVKFDGTIYTTNAEGKVVIEDVEVGNYSYTVSLSGYTEVTGTVDVTDANVNEPVSLSPLMYTITFAVTEGNNPIEGATVNFDGTNYTTNAEGKVVIEGIKAGNYGYTVSMSGYTEVTGAVDVTDADVNEPVSLSPLMYTITFAVTASSSPIEGATVKFDGTNYTTNAEGKAVIVDVQIGNYSYMVSMSGYTEVTGTVDVTDANVSVPVSLSPNSVEPNEISTIRAYPNPFDSYITITNAEKVRRVVVTNLIGQKVMIFNSNGEATVNTSDLRSGIYLITFEGQNGQSTIRRMIKK